MTTGELLRTSWDWEPSIVIGCTALLALYLWLARPLSKWSVLRFSSGVVLCLLTLVGPLDGLGDEYLFSAHMLEHLLLLVAVPPLLILGIPGAAVERLLRLSWAAGLERRLGRPAVAWPIVMVTLYAWHLPIFYNAALADERVHAAEHLSFLVTATIFWWPLLAPVEPRRLEGPAAIAYLFLAALANTVLGVVLTFAPPGIYPQYDRVEGSSRALALIRQGWGLDPAADQELGGLFMWVVGGLFFLGAILAAYGRWYKRSGQPGLP